MAHDPLAVGAVGLLEAAVVGDVLALRHLAVDVQADVVELVGRVLVDDALGALAERLHRHVVPPLLEVAVAVELAALVVEAVRDLVADDDADAAVVERLGELAAVEQRLQDAGRKN